MTVNIHWNLSLVETQTHTLNLELFFFTIFLLQKDADILKRKMASGTAP